MSNFKSHLLTAGSRAFLSAISNLLQSLYEAPGQSLQIGDLSDLEQAIKQNEVRLLIVGDLDLDAEAVKGISKVLRENANIQACILAKDEKAVSDIGGQLANLAGRVEARMLELEDSGLSGDTAAALKGRIKNAISRLVPEDDDIQVSYEKDGVYLFVDPSKIRRITTSREALSREQLRSVKIFMERVIQKLQSLKLSGADAQAISFVVSSPVATPQKIAPPQEKSSDGSYSFELEEGRLYVNLIPPRGKGDPIDAKKLRKAAAKTLEGASWFYFDDALESAFKFKKSEPFRLLLAERRDAKYELEIAEDGMDVWLTLEPCYGGEELDAAEIAKQLEERGVRFGVKQKIVSQMFKLGVYGERTSIAEGKRPTPGKDGGYEILWDKENKEDEEGGEKKKLDLRKVGRLTFVQEGELMASIYPPTKGKPGTDVFGEEVAAEDGKPMMPMPYTGSGKADEHTLYAGEGVEIAEDWKGLRCSSAGAPQIVDGIVSVLPVHQVHGDVDYAVGNIDFSGNVVVEGNVLSKFQVKAGGSIIVKGVVEDAILDAGCDIIVEQNVVGSERAILFARRDIRAKNIHSANIFAMGEIHVEQSVHHSRLVSYKAVRVGDKLDEGQLVGGWTKAAGVIDAAELGGVNYTRTPMEVGSFGGIEAEFKALRDAYKKSRFVASKASSLNRGADKKKEDERKTEAAQGAASLPEEAHDSEALLHEVFLEWIDLFLATEAEVLNRPEAHIDHARASAVGRKVIYPGVSVAFGKDIIRVEEVRYGCKVSASGIETFAGALGGPQKSKAGIIDSIPGEHMLTYRDEAEE